jgi:hypothetical protein
MCIYSRYILNHRHITMVFTFTSQMRFMFSIQFSKSTSLCCSSYSLHFSGGVESRSGSLAVQCPTHYLHSNLAARHRLISEGKAPPFPLLLRQPGEIRALLVCKVLLPPCWKEHLQHSHPQVYSTPVAAQVYPHFLVHVDVRREWAATNAITWCTLVSRFAPLIVSPRYDAFLQYRITVIQHRHAFNRLRNATRPSLRDAEKILMTKSRAMMGFFVLVVCVTLAHYTGSLA